MNDFFLSWPFATSGGHEPSWSDVTLWGQQKEELVVSKRRQKKFRALTSEVSNYSNLELCNTELHLLAINRSPFWAKEGPCLLETPVNNLLYLWQHKK